MLLSYNNTQTAPQFIERRRFMRVSVSMEARWSGLSGRAARARVSDISLGGCYIESLGHVAAGERIALEIQTQSGDWVRLMGEVVFHCLHMGFGLRFVSLSPVELDMVQQVMNRAEGNSGW